MHLMQSVSTELVQVRMFAKALFAFLAMPGIVAFAVPATWMWRGNRWTVVHPAGFIVLIAGTLGLLWCVRDFYVRGKGTLAPWSPPKHLVVVGLYRYTRNPMYVSVVSILLGWALTFGSSGVLIYALAIALAFHLRVVYGEEPWLARTHGDHWHGYVRAVPRWIGFTRSRQ
jgi:protein-S-isoprenylcysteine O-methyltransferase Ste14